MEAPEFYNINQTSGLCLQFSNQEKHHSLDSSSNKPNDFMVEDLLDFSNEDDDAVITDAFDNFTGGNSSTDSSTVTVVDSCNSSSFSGCEPNCFNGGATADHNIGSRNNFPDAHFSNDLCVPYDELAELEWLSNFVEESFSSEDLQKLQLISGVKARPDELSETRNFQPDNNANNIGDPSGIAANNNPNFHHEMSVPAKARSKRSRAAPCNWASRLLVLSNPTTSSPEPEIIIGPTPTHHPNTGKKTLKTPGPKRRVENGDNGDGRKCLHCATDKTPQWRTGPMGPKTLCNACGVRYKSGRLVPEYRPAASPTFVLTKHSNSHRKVLELRRQKEIVRAQQHQHHPFLQHHHHQNMMFDVSNGDDYLIHQHVGPDFRQLI